MFELYLFDFDGCLIDSLGLWLDAYKSALGYFGKEVTDEFIAREMFGDWDSPKKVGIKNLEKFIELQIDYFTKNSESLRLHKGIYQVLEKLKEEKKLIALITTSYRNYVVKILEGLEILTFFDLIVCGDDVENTKPDPEGIQKALHNFSIHSSKALMVGDSKHDIQAGKDAQTKTCLFYPAPNELFYNLQELQSIGPDFVVKSFADILNLS